MILQLGKFSYDSFGGIESVQRSIQNAYFQDGRLLLLSFSNRKLTGEQVGSRYITLLKQPISIGYIVRSVWYSIRADVVIMHWPNLMIIPALLLFRKKSIVFYHADATQKRKINLFLNSVLNHTQSIIFTSENYQNCTVVLNRHRQKYILPLTLDFEKNISRKHHAATNKDFVFIGRNTSYKGIEILIKAWSKSMAHSQGYSLHIFGAILNEDYSRNKIYSHGKFDNIEDVLGDAYCLILPSTSRQEAFGVVLLEAKYFGVPIISTDLPCSGMNYLNDGISTGLRFKPNDKNDLVYQIDLLIEKPELRDQLARNSYDSYEFFTNKNFQIKLKKIIDEIR
jgi:glycosyltransferase involved in cell wall biosynthesis